MLQRTLIQRVWGPATFCTTRCLLFEPADVRQRILLQRERKRIEAAEKSGQRIEEEVTDEELAERCGLLPPKVIDLAELRSREVSLAKLVAQQREKRVAKREAFLAWQQGQREKGSAMRLTGQAKRMESFKRAYCHALKHRLIATNLQPRAPETTTETRDNSETSCSDDAADEIGNVSVASTHAARQAAAKRSLMRLRTSNRHQDSAATYCDFLNSGSPDSKVRLSLRLGGSV